jgi:hypothetical protein
MWAGVIQLTMISETTELLKLLCVWFKLVAPAGIRSGYELEWRFQMEKNEFSLAKRLASIYARFSSKDRGREGSSITVQLRLLREYALRSGLAVEREHSEDRTVPISEK